MDSRRLSRFVSTVFDLAATIAEHMPAKLDTDRLVKLLGPNPVLPTLLGAPRSHIATPPGVSEEHYCLDCSSKHLGTAKVLLREALQRIEKGEPREAVLEKVRGAYEELMGAEDDTLAVKDEGIRRLNSLIRDTRKWFFDTGVIAEPDKKLIAEAFEKVSRVNDEVYREYEARRQRLREFIGKAKEKLEELEAKLSAQPKPA
jgi:hypothetical protein